MEESRSVGNSLKDMPDITLASVNCMGDMRTGQDIDRFRYHHIMIRELPNKTTIHKALYEFIKEVTRT